MAETQRKKAVIEAQEKGVASVAAAKKSAAETHEKMEAHKMALGAAQKMEAGCPDKDSKAKGATGDVSEESDSQVVTGTA